MSELSDLLSRCHSNPAPLTVWESSFLAQVEGRDHASPRQLATLERIANRVTADEIARRLAERIEDVAMTLQGEKPTYTHGSSIRYGAHLSLSIVVRGQKRGTWIDHTTRLGGGPLGLVEHLRGQGRADAIAWAKAFLRIEDGQPLPPSLPRLIKPTAEPVSTLPFARQIWREAVPAAGTLAETYLVSRGLTLPARKILRFHPACRRGEERLPAMIALMLDPSTGEPCGVHRTFLQADGRGKASGQAKMMLGNAGVIRLSPDSEVTTGLGIAEGIETALSLIQVAGWSPVWAAGNAGNIAGFPVLAGIEALTIFADGDAAGLRAANACADRWRDEGREVTIRAAPAGKDWNDVATSRRAAA